MAGRVIQGRFGGLSAVDAPSNAPQTSADPSSAAGNPVTPGDVQKQLELIMHNAQVAAARLVQIPPPGSIPADTLKQLLDTYITIQGNVADIVSRLGTADPTTTAKDATAVQQQVQEFIDGVEAAIKAVAPQASATLAPASKKPVPWLLIGGGALGLLAIGVAVYQMQQAQARAARAASRRSTAFAGLVGTARKRRKGKRKRTAYAED